MDFTFIGAHAEFTHMPLYPRAPISKEASVLACNYFAITNKLSDAATKQLLDLIRIYCCSDATQFAPCMYKLKKLHICSNDFEMYRFCSQCMKKLDDLQLCSENTCGIKKAQACYLAFLPFHKHLTNIFTGMYKLGNNAYNIISLMQISGFQYVSISTKLSIKVVLLILMMAEL